MRKVSPKTLTRALFYIRTLNRLLHLGGSVVSSKELADIMGFSDAQVRKDISNFGKVGKPRIGYKVAELKQVLEDFLVQDVVHAALFGVGNLGSAILRYSGFHQNKIKLVAAFDIDKNKIGKTINGVPVYAMKDIREIVRRTHVDIGIIAAPEEASQDIADLIVGSGLKGIVNFAPTSVSVPKGVFVKDIDLSIEFLSLFCDMQHS
ncbi:MAG: redox-sensing transcriptional repressor Rex [Candidatus Omnitrophica bacterium]|nr:redox-sensing transcriptional repressor Rex [Candidatus Omnitrophota bacterium]